MADCENLNEKFERECHLSEFVCNEIEEDDDDWFYDSIQRYKHLLMYDLASPASALEVCDPQMLCLAMGRETVSGIKNELLTLTIPAKLQTMNNEEEGLCKHRDFEVAAGTTTKSQINNVSPIPESNRIAVSTCNGVSLFQSDYTTGTISEVVNLNQSQPHAKIATSATHLASAALLNNVNIYDFLRPEPTQVLRISESPEQLSEVKLLGSDTVVTCVAHSGMLYSCDLRSNDSIEIRSALTKTLDNSQTAEWTFDIHQKSFLIGQLNRQGYVSLRDIRKPNVNVVEYELPSESHQSSRLEHLKIRFSPCGSMFSVSGLDETVRIYSVRCNAKPLFVHDGHKRPVVGSQTNVITSHVWHPLIPHLIFSSSLNNSFHAWQFETVC